MDVKGFEDMFGVRFIQHSLFSLSYLRYLLTVKIPIPIGESVKARYKPLVDREMGILAEGNQSAATNNNFILCKINDYIGYGLFAARSFHQHEFLTVYCGIIEDSRVSSEFAPSNKSSNKTYNLCTVLEPIVINASSHRNLSAFINSSYYPNAYLRGYFDHAQTISILVSLVPIKKGEQITFAYDSDGSWFQNFNINPRQMEIFVLMIAMAMMTVFGLVATVIELKGKLNLESLAILAAISSFATAIVSNRQRIIIICAHVLHS